MTIPQDGAMLLSYINMKLRDEYENLETLCDDLDLEKVEIVEKLAEIGYTYSAKLNKFV